MILVWWKKVTLLRHRTELRALRAARLAGMFAIFPIFLTVGMWFFLLAGLPLMILFLLVQMLSTFGGLAFETYGITVLAISQIIALVALAVLTPWFFGWYFIAVGLMFGRSGMADRKEDRLLAAIQAAGSSS